MEHKKTCYEYRQLVALLPSVGKTTQGTSSQAGEKKRECPIVVVDSPRSDSDEDKENSAVPSSNRPRKLTKRVSAPVESAKTPKPLGVQELNSPPYLLVPGIGKESPLRTMFGGCFCCGNSDCRYANFTISDLRADPDDKLGEYDTRNAVLESSYRCFTKEELTREGSIVRDAVVCLLASEEVFSHHKYIGSKAFDDKLYLYFVRRLQYRPDEIVRFSVPLRLATKATLKFLRLECIECIREKFIGTLLNPSYPVMFVLLLTISPITCQISNLFLQKGHTSVWNGSCSLACHRKRYFLPHLVTLLPSSVTLRLLFVYGVRLPTKRCEAVLLSGPTSLQATLPSLFLFSSITYPGGSGRPPKSVESFLVIFKEPNP